MWSAVENARRSTSGTLLAVLLTICIPLVYVQLLYLHCYTRIPHVTGRKCDDPQCGGSLMDTIINFGENLPEGKGARKNVVDFRRAMN